MSPELIPWLATLAFLLGILALVLEVFILGFGVAGLVGIILIGWGIVLLSMDVTLTFKSLVIALAVSIVILIVGIKVMSRFNLWQRLTLGNRQRNDEGYSASKKELVDYAGQVGITLTPLRPSGAAEVGGERLDVVSEGGFIPAGAKIKVVRVEGIRIVVRTWDQT
ncbi:NfeD family protein [Desulfoscipio gibsoniae]|uniref:Membrane-bound serine protease (ClpP class) n=1 Tax=Desulfoscipio gibsoniae DSM 7213 TaxID=767817 RepID=R4KCD1_9FIRM|nr:NfeD family protein [Desulfoscipio gibsoniae]AGL00843.1 membrane-bound serine protease (ClpP class) [Desulfoscipio gibsoniae DSM 7213]